MSDEFTVRRRGEEESAQFDFDDFLHWEQSTRDTIDFKKVYVDVAEGDVLAGLLLSEIVYWHLPSRNGQSRLRVWHEKKQWIAVRRFDWWERTRLTPRQADRTLATLEALGLIETNVFKFDGNPTKHVRINHSGFLGRMQAVIDNPPTNPFSPNGENDVTPAVISGSPQGEMDVAQTGRSLTETTTKTTTETNKPTGAKTAPGNGSLPTLPGEEIEEDQEPPVSKESRSSLPPPIPLAPSLTKTASVASEYPQFEDLPEDDPVPKGFRPKAYDPDEEEANGRGIAKWRIPDPDDLLTSELFNAVGFNGRQYWPSGEFGRKLKARWKAIRQKMRLPPDLRDKHIPEDWVLRRIAEAKKHQWSLEVLLSRIEDMDGMQDFRLRQKRAAGPPVFATAQERHDFYDQ